jgi:hydroxysqualene synthase
MLGADPPDPAIAATVRALSARNAGLLTVSCAFAGQVKDLRLALEVGAIQTLAESLNRRLRTRDPFGAESHHSRVEALGVGLAGVSRTLAGRLASRLFAAGGP